LPNGAGIAIVEIDMTRERLLFLLAVACVIVFVGLGVAGVWWFLFGPNQIDSAELVPGNTVAFAEIPNGAVIVEAYESSLAKSVLESPNIKPLRDYLVNLVGGKNMDLLQAFVPNLSGQSFIAITHYDYDHPEQVGLIAAMKPKSGLGDFETFLEKIKQTWPDQIKNGKTGRDTVDGIDYEWFQPPGMTDKICVAQVKGWIVTTWGQAPLQDWIDRFYKKADTESLADNVDYRTSIARTGDSPMSMVYLNYHALLGPIQKQVAKTNPALADYLAKKLDAVGGGAIATRFENGEIVDHFSLLVPRPVQADYGVAADPCPYDTLKFTGPDTHFYWASSVNWKQYYENIKEQSVQTPTQPVNPMASGIFTFAQNWIHGTNLDTQQNIVDPLGSEISIQVDWTQDTTWPEAGMFVKVDKPDDFKPTIDAIVESVRKAYADTASVKELTLGDQRFAALKFTDGSILSPTITENGPYLGVFLTETQAVRAYQRDPTLSMMHNPNFQRQVGDQRNGSAQVFFLDTPYVLDRAYKTALPFVSFLGAVNKDAAAALQGKQLPPDLSWLAPVGTWACVLTPDPSGISGYSVSGIGDQGILLGAGLDEGTGLLQTMGFLPKPTIPSAPAAPSEMSIAPTPVPPAVPAPAPTASPAPAPTPSPPPAPTNTASNTVPSPLAPPTETNASSDVSPPPATPAPTPPAQ
jgi:hypothetical protein